MHGPPLLVLQPVFSRKLQWLANIIAQDFAMNTQATQRKKIP